MENCKNGLGIKDQKVRMKFFIFYLTTAQGYGTIFMVAMGATRRKPMRYSIYQKKAGEKKALLASEADDINRARLRACAIAQACPVQNTVRVIDTDDQHITAEVHVPSSIRRHRLLTSMMPV
ncbi:MAG: hypothetical protein WDA42_09230 [Candidatus Bathyarchaeia archaeon]